MARIQIPKAPYCLCSKEPAGVVPDPPPACTPVPFRDVWDAIQPSRCSTSVSQLGLSSLASTLRAEISVNDISSALTGDFSGENALDHLSSASAGQTAEQAGPNCVLKQHLLYCLPDQSLHAGSFWPACECPNHSGILSLWHVGFSQICVSVCWV